MLNITIPTLRMPFSILGWIPSFRRSNDKKEMASLNHLYRYQSQSLQVSSHISGIISKFQASMDALVLCQTLDFRNSFCMQLCHRPSSILGALFSLLPSYHSSLLATFSFLPFDLIPFTYFGGSDDPSFQRVFLNFQF